MGIIQVRLLMYARAHGMNRLKRSLHLKTGEGEGK